MMKTNARMTRAQKAVVKIDNMLETVTAQALAQGYKAVTLATNPDDLGPMYWVKADACIIGQGNNWTTALAEALEYLRD